MYKTEEELILKIEALQALIAKGELPSEKEVLALKKEAIDKSFLSAEFLLDLALARLYFYKKNFQDGIDLLEKNIPRIKALDKNLILGKTYNLLAGLYDKINDSHRTLTYFIKACDVFEALNDQLRKAETLSNIGTYYGTRLHDEKKSEAYLLQAWSIFKNISDVPSKWHVLYSLGSLYRRIGEDKESKKYFDLSFDYAVKIDNHIGISYGYYAKSRYEEQHNRYDNALRYIERTIEILEDNNISFGLDIYLLYKAEYLNKLGRVPEAVAILEGVAERSKRINEQAESNFLLYQIFSEKKDFKKALFHFKKYLTAKNEMLDVDTKKHIEITEAKFQEKVKIKENEILKLQKWEMEQKALRAKLNPDFFFNSLQLVHTFLLEKNKESASQFLHKFSRLMRKTLENSNESLITIEDEIDYLKDYLTIEQLRLNMVFDFEIIEDENLDADFVTIPTMMLQPFVAASVCNFTEDLDNAKITISFLCEENDVIKCVIEDNGSQSNNLVNGSLHTKGISILELRIKNLYEQYKIKINLNIVDLKTEEGDYCGRKVELLIPAID